MPGAGEKFWWSAVVTAVVELAQVGNHAIDQCQCFHALFRINGAHEEGWLTVLRTYFCRAESLSEIVPQIVPAEAGHFELVTPVSTTFPVVRRGIEAMLK